MISTVEKISPYGATNFFDAIKAGMDIINRREDCTNNASMIFFTDGQPTEGLSDQSLIDALKAHKKEVGFSYPVHTMCFGQYTNCSSDLLLKISEEFDGMIGYIQDARTVGTVFINAIGYTLATAVNSLQIDLSMNSQQLVPKFDDSGYKSGPIRIPGLRYGQSCDMIFGQVGKQEKIENLKVQISYSINGQ